MILWLLLLFVFVLCCSFRFVHVLYLDPFVMKAWGDASNVGDKVGFLWFSFLFFFFSLTKSYFPFPFSSSLVSSSSQILLLADPVAAFTKAVGLSHDFPPLGGIRSKRYSAVVEDGVVKHLNVEPDNGGLTCSLSNIILSQI